jgi:hypothetical protein
VSGRRTFFSDSLVDVGCANGDSEPAQFIEVITVFAGPTKSVGMLGACADGTEAVPI